MFKKLLSGGYSLRVTFWKFGIFGLLVLNVFASFAQGLFLSKTKGIGLLEYYTVYFKPFRIDSNVFLYTLTYVFSLALIIAFGATIIYAIWKSSKNYDKSFYLKHLSRFLIVLFVLASFFANI